jgi:hypothetical protein
MNLYKRRSNYCAAFNGSSSSAVKPVLRKEFKKFGRESFVFRVLEYVPFDEVLDNKYLSDVEHCWILASSDLAYNSRVWNVSRVRVKRDQLEAGERETLQSDSFGPHVETFLSTLPNNQALSSGLLWRLS